MNNINKMNCGCGNRKALFEAIQATSFAMDDLRLFLDTHPDNEEALALFGEYMKKRSEQVAQYTEKYGPIDSYNVNIENGWTWTDEPLPWKGGI